MGVSRLLSVIPTLAPNGAAVIFTLPYFGPPSVGAILGYELVSTTAGKITIQDWVLQQAWYANALSSFGGTPADAKVAEGLCLDIKGKMVTLGLNSSDADLVVWAVITGVKHPQVLDRAKSWGAADACKKSVAGVK